jgi:hypothetical protein
MKLLILLIAIPFVISRPVILSSGLGNYTDVQLQQQYRSFKAYKDIEIITGASMLIYNLNYDGTLGLYNTSSNTTAEHYQRMLKTNLGLNAYPCLYCDSTIGMCSNLSSRLDNLYQNMDNFIKNTVFIAVLNKWDGYQVDFEPDTDVDSTNVTNFILEWGYVLKMHNMQLFVWIGGNVPYDDRIYNDKNLILITMDTYEATYNSFVSTASNEQMNMYDITKLGFGLETNCDFKDYENDTSSDINQIVNWSILTKSNSLSLWASHISPFWYYALHKYVSAQ